ncbi:hypothetical protein J6590_031562 [Homalodisca vitripennis]|nr:hypothetical protein J6590_031562 [Homalodisca vitripennis]
MSLLNRGDDSSISHKLLSGTRHHPTCERWQPVENLIATSGKLSLVRLSHWCKGDSYGCPFVTSRLTSPLIARLSNLQTVAGHIATAIKITS